MVQLQIGWSDFDGNGTLMNGSNKMVGELMALSASLVGLAGVLIGVAATKKIKTLEDRVRKLEEAAAKG